jgi:hypothetical protein
MTAQHVAEISSVSIISALTTAGIMTEADVSGLAVPLLSTGVAAVVGYFSAQITVRSELATLQAEVRHLREEMHRYYAPAERRIRHKQDQDDRDDGA